MTMKVVIVSSQAATFNYYNALAISLERAAIEVEWWILKEHEAFFFSTINKACKIIDHFPSNIEELLKTWGKPDLFLLGMSVEVPGKVSIENSLLSQRKIWNVPIIAGQACLPELDSWTNYRTQSVFSEDIVYPDQTMVIDKASFTAYKDLGIPEHTLRIVGQPYFDEFQKNYSISKHISNGKLLFPTQPIRRYFGNSLNYDEFSVLKDLLLVLETPPPWFRCLSIKAHPESDISEFEFFLRRSSVPYEIAEGPHWFASNLVVGMRSTILILSRLLDTPTLSYQPKVPKSEDCFSNLKWVATIKSIEELDYAIHNHTDIKAIDQPYKSVGSSIHRMWQVLNPYINQQAIG
tara:strand:+ start:1600 stop:2649 length:1050 start_codon:yes stop_codon:yes gene_type:complete